jgi:hypothetical protein
MKRIFGTPGRSSTRFRRAAPSRGAGYLSDRDLLEVDQPQNSPASILIRKLASRTSELAGSSIFFESTSSDWVAARLSSWRWRLSLSSSILPMCLNNTAAAWSIASRLDGLVSVIAIQCPFPHNLKCGRLKCGSF